MTDQFENGSIAREYPLWNASLSTMWARGNFASLKDFFETAYHLGYAHIEINHQINSAMLANIDLSQYSFSSIHEPCPADIPSEVLRARDWLISSPDKDNRTKGLDAIKRSIDLAAQLHVPAIVVHAGNVQNDVGLEKELKILYKNGQSNSNEFRNLLVTFKQDRQNLVAPRFEAVQQSLLELLRYTAGSGIRLGLENRYHYMDIPVVDEMGILLAMSTPDRLGMIYDVGHAQTLDRLGLYPWDEWLKRYGPRIIGAHLHDVVGTTDHYAPGLGEVDFSLIAPYLPSDCFRTLELSPGNTRSHLVSALKVLADHGCITSLA